MKYIIAALAAVAVALAGYASWLRQNALEAAVTISRQATIIHDQKEAIDAQEAAAKRLARAANLYESQLQNLRSSTAASRIALDSAKQGDPVWLSTDLPKPVIDWLREH